MTAYNNIVSLLCVLLSLRLESVQSCGGFMCFPQEPILQVGENIAFGVSANADGDYDVTMAVQINYAGPASDFAWVLPVMFEPRVSVGSDIMFDVLFETSQPVFDLTIRDRTEGTTCEDVRLGGPCAFMATMESASFMADEGAATVLQEDSVGPYDYVVLEPAETEPGLSVFTWLDDNGYDQPIEAFSLIDYYARQGQLFLAIRLSKGSETGDIQPLVMDYVLPGEMANVACVPIQLTSIAATPDMPIQIYVLSEGTRQAFPVNYFSVELDDARADWLGCQNSPNCYINDMRARLSTFLEEEGINGHAFVTEYAGTSNIIGEDSIAIDVNLTALESSTTVSEFFALLVEANVPGNDLVNSIIGRYVSNEYQELAFFSCTNDPNVYRPSFGERCHNFLAQETIDDPSSLVRELNEAVFGPTTEAQRFVNRFDYLSRFYGQLSPENMDKDPFFAFNSMLPDVSNVHEATAVPVCTDRNLEGLEITVGDTSFIQPARVSCQQWFANGDAEFPDDVLGTLTTVSMATRLTAFGYEGEDPMVALRSAETGFFPPDIVTDIVTFMDSRVPDQTVPPYNGTFLSGPQEVVATTDEDDGNTVDIPEIATVPPQDTSGPDIPEVDTPSDNNTTDSPGPDDGLVPMDNLEPIENDPPVEEPSEEPAEEGEEVTVAITPLTNAPVTTPSAGWKASITANSRFIVIATLFHFTIFLL